MSVRYPWTTYRHSQLYDCLMPSWWSETLQYAQSRFPDVTEWEDTSERQNGTRWIPSEGNVIQVVIVRGVMGDE